MRTIVRAASGGHSRSCTRMARTATLCHAEGESRRPVVRDAVEVSSGRPPFVALGIRDRRDNAAGPRCSGGGRLTRQYACYMASPEEIASFVERRLPHLVATCNPHREGLLSLLQGSAYESGPFASAPDLAQAWLDDADFRALQLGTWLRTADGELVTQAVALVIPPQYRFQFELVVDALQLAARLQHEQCGRMAARNFLVGALAAAGLYAVATSATRQAA